MTAPLDFALLEQHLRYLAETLRVADGAPFRSAVQAALQDIADWRAQTITPEEAERRLRDHYRSLFWGGHGDFSEFFIMEDDVDARPISNADLDWSRSVLWKSLG